MLVVKPVGRGYRLTSRITIEGGHMERALDFRVGQLLPWLGVTYRVLEVLP